MESGAKLKVGVNGLGGGMDGSMLITDAGTIVDLNGNSLRVNENNNFILRNGAVITNCNYFSFNNVGSGTDTALTNSVHVRTSVFGVNGNDRTVIFGGADSFWQHDRSDWEDLRIGLVNSTNFVSHANSLTVTDGGVLKHAWGIAVGGNGTNSFDNSLVLGSGGTVITPYINVGRNGAISNLLVCAGGAVFADTLEIFSQNGIALHASSKEFEPSAFTTVSISENTYVMPTLVDGFRHDNVFPLITADIIYGFENLELHPSVDPDE